MNHFGENLVTNGGRLERTSCAPVTVSVTVPAAPQTATLRWTVGRGEGVSASMDVESEGQKVTKNMTACLARGAEHYLRVTGHVSAGSAFDRFSAVAGGGGAPFTHNHMMFNPAFLFLFHLITTTTWFKGK